VRGGLRWSADAGWKCAGRERAKILKFLRVQNGSRKKLNPRSTRLGLGGFFMFASHIVSILSAEISFCLFRSIRENKTRLLVFEGVADE